MPNYLLTIIMTGLMEVWERRNPDAYYKYSTTKSSCGASDQRFLSGSKVNRDLERGLLSMDRDRDAHFLLTFSSVPFGSDGQSTNMHSTSLAMTDTCSR